MIVDDEELYEREKPLPLDDIRCLIIILREVLLLSIISFLCTCSFWIYACIHHFSLVSCLQLVITIRTRFEPL